MDTNKKPQEDKFKKIFRYTSPFEQAFLIFRSRSTLENLGEYLDISQTRVLELERRAQYNLKIRYAQETGHKVNTKSLQRLTRRLVKLGHHNCYIREPLTTQRLKEMHEEFKYNKLSRRRPEYLHDFLTNQDIPKSQVLRALI